MFFLQKGYKTKYNINNLLLIQKNIKNIKSNIYKEKNIENLIIKKQKLIKKYIYLNNKILFYKQNLSKIKNIYYYQFLTKILINKNEMNKIENKLKKIEWEEELIIKSFKISKYNIINFINNIINKI